MDLDKYIGENIDDILDNPNEFVSQNLKIIYGNEKEKKNKKVAFSQNIPFKNYDELDSDEREYLDYNQEFFDDYYNQNESEDEQDIQSDSDTKTNLPNEVNFTNKSKLDDTGSTLDIKYTTNQEIILEKEPNEDDYTEDIIGELYQDMYASNMNKLDIIDVVKNITQDDLKKLDSGEYLNNDTSDMCGFEKNEKNNNRNNDNDYNNMNGSNDLDEFANDDGYYFFNLINIFTKYYNNKYDKIEHFFSEIKDTEKGVSSQMNLFLDSAIEYKIVKEHYKLNNDECMGLIFNETDTEKTIELFEKWDKQIYMLEFDSIRLLSPSLLVCLNYIYQKNNSSNDLLNSDWDIYNLRNY